MNPPHKPTSSWILLVWALPSAHIKRFGGFLKTRLVEMFSRVIDIFAILDRSSSELGTVEFTLDFSQIPASPPPRPYCQFSELQLQYLQFYSSLVEEKKMESAAIPPLSNSIPPLRDFFSQHPWRAPGTAPLHSPCGVAGGNPQGCPKEVGYKQSHHQLNTHVNGLYK